MNGQATPPGSPRDAARARIAVLVERYRQVRARLEKRPALAERVRALADFQSRRLAETYADLRKEERHRAAIDFFLADLYGPQDLSERDRQMLAALDKLQRFLPAGALEALAGAFELHVLTLELDADTAAALASPSPLGMAEYAAAYRAAGRAADRLRQIELIADIGGLLDGLAHHPEIGLALRLSRAPARAAGYGELQDFLERGYRAFRAMDGAGDFLAAIDARERKLMSQISRMGGAG
ncbi:MAG: hypothetical protein MUC71_11005 [Steroidobacteraceae bacterium]|nr:hypothetical protein [Steroidobacteraceae bacterium]